MITQKTHDRLHDIMALADAHAYAKIMPGTPREKYPYYCLRAEIQSLLAENETLRHKLQTLDELGAAGDDVQLLRMGYAAARLEIASLQGRVNECGAGAGCCAQAARIEALQAQLEAVGGGGVGPLLGAPAQPVALLVRKKSWLDGQWECAPKGFGNYGIQWADERMWVYAAPQPATAQEARKPLTDEQIDQAIAELGLNCVAEAHTNNRAVLHALCRRAAREADHGITDAS